MVWQGLVFILKILKLQQILIQTIKAPGKTIDEIFNLPDNADSV